MKTELMDCLGVEHAREKASTRHRTAPRRLFPMLLIALLALGCGDDSGGGAGGTGGDGGGGGIGGGGGAGEPTGPRYVVASLVFGPSGTTSYVKVLDDLEPQEVNFDDAREIPGQGDVWVYGSNVYIAVDEGLTIQRFTIAADGTWQEGETIGFGNFGVGSVAFWNNTFISANKAYLANGTAEYIIWDPEAMLIGETIDIPQLPGPQDMRVSFADRAVVMRDGLLYQTVHWADDDLADFAPNSAILVFDTETDTHVNTIDAPCPGLDTATQDDEGNLYFSNWVFSVGAHVVLDEPENCIVRIPAGSEEIDDSWTVSFSTLLEGREGAAARHLSGDTAIIAVFHDEDVEIGEDSNPSEVIAGADWSAQYLDLNTQTATLVDGIDRNSGAFYSAQVAGRSFVLVPGVLYDSTTVYEVQPGQEAVELFELLGWSLRLFELP